MVVQTNQFSVDLNAILLRQDLTEEHSLDRRENLCLV